MLTATLRGMLANKLRLALTTASIALGVAFLGAGGYAAYRGFDARDQVHDELVAQNITTPDDASIPGVLVDDVATARSMADIIGAARAVIL